MRARLLRTGWLAGPWRSRHPRRFASGIARERAAERGARAHAELTARERDELSLQEDADAWTRLERRELDKMRLDRLRKWFKSATPSSAESARQYLRELYMVPRGLSEASAGVALVWCNNAHCIQNYFFPVAFPQAGLVPGIRSYNILIRQLILEGRPGEARRVLEEVIPDQGLSPNEYTYKYLSMDDRKLVELRSIALSRRPLFERSPLPFFHTMLKQGVFKGHETEVTWIKHALAWCSSYPEMMQMLLTVSAHVQHGTSRREATLQSVGATSELCLPNSYGEIQSMLEEQCMLEGWDPASIRGGTSSINSTKHFGLRKRRIQHLRQLCERDMKEESDISLTFFQVMQQNRVESRSALNVMLQHHCNSAEEMLRMLVYGWAAIGERKEFQPDQENLRKADPVSTLAKRCHLRNVETPMYHCDTVTNLDTEKEMYQCTCSVLDFVTTSGVHPNKLMARADAARAAMKCKWPLFNAFGMLEAKCQAYGYVHPTYSLRTIENDSASPTMYQYKCSAHDVTVTSGIHTDISAAKSEAAENALLSIQWPTGEDERAREVDRSVSSSVDVEALAEYVQGVCKENGGWKEAVDIGTMLSEVERGGLSLRAWVETVAGLVYDDVSKDTRPVVRLPGVRASDPALGTYLWTARNNLATETNCAFEGPLSREIHVSSVNLICDRFMLEGDYAMANECLELLSCPGDGRTRNILNQTEAELNRKRNKLMREWTEYGTQRSMIKTSKLQSQLLENGRMSVVWAKAGKNGRIPSTDGRRNFGDIIEFKDVAGPNEEIF
eukprot:g816.t1